MFMYCFIIKLEKMQMATSNKNLTSVSFRAGKKHGDTMFSLSLQGHLYQLHHTQLDYGYALPMKQNVICLPVDFLNNL